MKKGYLPETAEVVELHIFVDESLDVMCIVAYPGDQQTGEVVFVVRKCREAPMQQQSTRRLELQAAMYGTRLKQLIIDEHDIEIKLTFFRTGSTTVL